MGAGNVTLKDYRIADISGPHIANPAVPSRNPKFPKDNWEEKAIRGEQKRTVVTGDCVLIYI